MALPTNAFQSVQTYQRSALAYLLNLCCFISTANTKFKDFDKIQANLGATVTYDLPPRYATNDTLIATFQGSEQRVRSLTVDKAKNVAISFSAEQLIFNAERYMDQFGRSSISELANVVESDVASTIIPNTYRFYGDGVTAINSFGQLAQMLAYYRNYGAPKNDTKGYLSDLAVADIVNNGLTQFVMDRNEEMAVSWMVGKFSNCDWYQSNLLPTHIAGNVGENGTTLTITAVTTDADGGISAITASGGGADADAIKQYDLLQIQDTPTIVRYRTFVGHTPCQNPVQIQATADAASVTDSVTIPIYPKLYSAAGRNQNVTTAIVAGMTLKALPSHRAGLLCAANPLFVAMPQLPDEAPFPTANKADPDTGVALRMYYGSKFGENEHGMVHDVIWGKDLVPEYSMRIVFPL
ncbi:MAG: hypothetical protein FK731_15610 [Asgard group archaeon]|nr:hypothetical protein [Asgard group archaeon]